MVYHSKCENNIGIMFVYRWMAETAMAIITGTSRPADVMKIVVSNMLQ